MHIRKVPAPTMTRLLRYFMAVRMRKVTAQTLTMISYCKVCVYKKDCKSIVWDVRIRKGVYVTAMILC